MIPLLLLLLAIPLPARAAEPPPAVVHTVQPAYPKAARDAGIEGTVVVDLVLDAEGRVTHATVATSAGDLLDQTALDAAPGLRFAAGAADRHVSYAFTFHLSHSEVGGPPAPATLHGEVTDPDGNALAGVTVTLRDTDDPSRAPVVVHGGTRGRFTAPFLHPGTWQVQIARPDYVTRTFEVTLQPGQVIDGSFQLPAEEGLEVVVYGDRPTWREVDRGKREADPRPVTGEYVLTRRDIESTPGSMEDVVRAAHALPGVVSDGDLLSGMNVRGGDQGDVVYLLDGVPLDSPFHLAGYNSIFNPDMIQSVRFFAGAPPADVPAGTSAVMDVHSWDGRPREPGKGLDGAIDLSAGDARGFVLGPIDKQGHLTFALAARRTFLEAYFQVLKWFNVLDTAFVAPEFSELSGRLSWRPNDHQQTILTALRGGDSLGVINSGDQSLVQVSGDFELHSGLTLLSLSHTWTPSDHAGVRAVAAWTEDRSTQIRTLAGSTQRLDRLRRLYGRLDAHWTGGPVTLQAGGDVSGLTAATTGTIEDKRYVPAWTQAGLADLGLPAIDVAAERHWLEASAYGQVEVKGPVRLRAGARAWQSSLAGGPFLSPSLGISVPFPTGTIPKVSWGRYVKLQRDPVLVDPTLGNPNLAPERAEHLVVGLDQGFAVPHTSIHGLLRVEAYRITLHDLVVNPDDPSVLASEPAYTNQGTGTNSGVDVMAVARAGRWSAQASWSLLHAVRENPRNTLFPQTVAPPWDQRQTLTLMGDWQAFPHWKLTARYSFHTGRPVSDVTPASADTVALTCLNCDRLGTLHEVDLRAEWRRAYAHYRLTFYAEVLNVGNIQSPFLPIQSVQDGQLVTSTLNHLPMRPFVGLRLDF